MNSSRHIQEIEERGYSIATDAIDRDFCEEIRSEISRLEAIGPPSIKQSEFTGYRTLRYFDLLNKAEVWERVATHPLVLDVVRGVLGNDMLLSTMGTAVIDPGETAQAIHCDDQLYGMRRPHKNLVCNTMWALSDFTDENGATRLVAGSHKFDHYPKIVGNASDEPAKPPATIAAEMPEGSICFIVGTCYHGGGANQSTERRWGLTINYCAGSQRQQENLMLAHSRSKLRTFSDELQRIIGLSTSLGGVGHIDAGDPKAILNKPD
ncbi:MAG: phytanoyl-CoA dioxygenase family protein [Gammaproteobacteria bacterium]|nr:phytanoyl-CoA dioxygenase family protein [Gammaproteobacteria bacterium]